MGISHAADVVLVEAMLFISRGELAGMETVAKRFRRLIQSHPFPQLHIIPFFKLDAGRLVCESIDPEEEDLNQMFKRLQLTDVEPHDDLYAPYVRFEDVTISSDDLSQMPSERNMQWLHGLRHAFDSTSLWLYVSLEQSMAGSNKVLEEMLEIFTECHYVGITSDCESEEQREHAFKVASLARWLHSGGVASRTAYDGDQEIVDEWGNYVMGYKTLLYRGYKWASLLYQINQHLFDEIRVELGKIFLSDQEEHPYCLSFGSKSHYPIAEHSMDKLRNPLTGEQLRFTAEYRAQSSDYKHMFIREREAPSKCSTQG